MPATAALVEEPAEEPAYEEPAAKSPRRQFTLPALGAWIASALTGAVVGLGIVVLTFLSARGCAAVKGTASCGGVGLLLLVAILALGVLLGAALLRAFGIGDATSSSFLAVGLVSVIAMLFFLPQIDSPWMVLVIPALTAAAYLFSWWIARTFIDSAEEA